MNAIFFPSGAQTGVASSPGRTTSGLTFASATDTIERSASKSFPRSRLMRWSKAIDRLSGDHENRPTANAPSVSRLVVFDARSSAYRWLIG